LDFFLWNWHLGLVDCSSLLARSQNLFVWYFWNLS
jgi:hypothetical protein